MATAQTDDIGNTILVSFGLLLWLRRAAGNASTAPTSRRLHLTFRPILSKSSNEPPHPHSRRRDGGVSPPWFSALVDRAGGGGGRADAAGAVPSFQIQGSAVPRRDRAAARERAGCRNRR